MVHQTTDEATATDFMGEQRTGIEPPGDAGRPAAAGQRRKWEPCDSNEASAVERRRGVNGHTAMGEVLRKAVSRASASWSNEVGDAVDHQEAAVVLDMIVDAIDPPDKAASPDPRLRSVLGRRLLEDVRSQLVLELSQQEPVPPAEEMLATFAAIETLRTAIEPDMAERFASRFSGAEGLEHLVAVAHDLRSPLTSILFLSETLQRRLSGDLNELQYRQIGLIYSASLGLSELASNLIEMARGGNRLAENELTPLSVSAIMESGRDIVRPLAEEKGLEVRLSPPANDHRLGYPLALSRVLLNLITNALKFTDSGFVEVVARETSRTRVEFSVRDTGRGINPAALERLYSPFRRTRHGEGYAFSGTGLGLALCRRLVDVMNSTLHVETKADWGTRFFFSLDLEPITHDQEAPEQLVRPTAESLQRSKPT